MFKAETVYTGEYHGMSIMIREAKDAWDVYYSKPDYPFIYAFGIPFKQGEMLTHYADAVEIACANAEEYDDLFG